MLAGRCLDKVCNKENKSKFLPPYVPQKMKRASPCVTMFAAEFKVLVCQVCTLLGQTLPLSTLVMKHQQRVSMCFYRHCSRNSSLGAL